MLWGNADCLLFVMPVVCFLKLRQSASLFAEMHSSLLKLKAPLMPVVFLQLQLGLYIKTCFGGTPIQLAQKALGARHFNSSSLLSHGSGAQTSPFWHSLRSWGGLANDFTFFGRPNDDTTLIARCEATWGWRWGWWGQPPPLFGNVLGGPGWW